MRIWRVSQRPPARAGRRIWRAFRRPRSTTVPPPLLAIEEKGSVLSEPLEHVRAVFGNELQRLLVRLSSAAKNHHRSAVLKVRDVIRLRALRDLRDAIRARRQGSVADLERKRNNGVCTPNGRFGTDYACEQRHRGRNQRNRKHHFSNA